MASQKLLYNRQNNKGYIVGLLNHLRQKLYKTEEENPEDKTSKKRLKKDTKIITPNNNDFQNYEKNENLIILKNCDPNTQINLMKQKLSETLELRLGLMKNNIVKKISYEFPFFMTNPELVITLCFLIQIDY